MKRTELNLLQRLWLETLWLGARVFAVMPYWFKYYVVENVLFGLLYYCLRYRMKVVKTNLRNSFPEKSRQELAVIRRKFYRTLSEIFVSAGLYSPPPVRKLSCCPAVAGGTRPDVPAVDTVAPSYSGTEMMPLLTVRPSPMRPLKIPSDQVDQIFSLFLALYATRTAPEVPAPIAKAI